MTSVWSFHGLGRRLTFCQQVINIRSGCAGLSARGGRCRTFVNGAHAAKPPKFDVVVVTYQDRRICVPRSELKGYADPAAELKGLVGLPPEAVVNLTWKTPDFPFEVVFRPEDFTEIANLANMVLVKDQPIPSLVLVQYADRRKFAERLPLQWATSTADVAARLKQYFGVDDATPCDVLWCKGQAFTEPLPNFPLAEDDIEREVAEADMLVLQPRHDDSQGGA